MLLIIFLTNFVPPNIFKIIYLFPPYLNIYFPLIIYTAYKYFSSDIKHYKLFNFVLLHVYFVTLKTLLNNCCQFVILQIFGYKRNLFVVVVCLCPENS